MESRQMEASTRNAEAIERDKQVAHDFVNGREETPEKERVLPEARIRKYKKTSQKRKDFGTK